MLRRYGNVEFTGATGYALVGFAAVHGSGTLDNDSVAYVVGNTVDADLSCPGNGVATDLFPQISGVFPNTAGRAKLGDCAGL